MNEDFYKGVLIRCREYKLADDRGFMASFTLVQNVGGKSEEMPYGPTRSFKPGNWPEKKPCVRLTLSLINYFQISRNQK
jgi:hypothetical protein